MFPGLQLARRTVQGAAPGGERGCDNLRVGHLINGESVDDSGGEYLPSYDPVTGEAWCEVRRGTADDVDAAVTAAATAFRSWRNTGPSERAELLWRLSEIIVGHSERSP